MKILLLHEQFEIVFRCEDGATLTAAEVWIPAPGPEEINVGFCCVGIFRAPAREPLNGIRALGHGVETSEVHHPTVPHLALGFTTEGGDEVPLDTDGLPFQAVLVGPEDYYDVDYHDEDDGDTDDGAEDDGAEDDDEA